MLRNLSRIPNYFIESFRYSTKVAVPSNRVEKAVGQRLLGTATAVTQNLRTLDSAEQVSLLDTRANNSHSLDVVNEINDVVKAKTHGRLFAVVYISGKQFKITEEDVILIQGYWAPDIGDRLRLEKVMLIGSSDFTLLGKPLLPQDLVRIEATVIEKTLSHNKLHFRHKPRKNYHRLYFFKTPYTMLRINLIRFDALVDEVKNIEGLRESPVW